MSGHLNYHVQCKLTKMKNILGGPGFGQSVQHLEETAWIPEEYAIRGNYIKLKQNGNWSDGWMIDVVHHGTKQESGWIQTRSQDHKNMKKMTDI